MLSKLGNRLGVSLKFRGVTTMSTPDDFVALSEALTGITPLDRELAEAYQARFVSHPIYGTALPNLIAAFKLSGDSASIKSLIVDHPQLGPAAQQLILLWYVSAFYARTKPDSAAWQYGEPEHYGRGLAWSVMRAHAPMTPGGPYGYWSDPPADPSFDNAPSAAKERR